MARPKAVSPAAWKRHQKGGRSMSEQKVLIGGKPSRWDEELRSWLEGYLDSYPHHTLEVLSRSQYIGAPRAALESYLEGLYFLPKESGGEGNITRTSERSEEHTSELQSLRHLV